MSPRCSKLILTAADLVANIFSAGSKDSALTNHGYQQATRLGQHLSTLGWSFTHIFSSHLQRAVKTAGLIREAQLAPTADHAYPRRVPNVVQLPVLMEQHFGFYEGKKFHERPADGGVTGKDHHRQVHKDDGGFEDVESKESLAQRADSFLDNHLMPIIHESTADTQQVIAVVSHGIMLSTLWKRLLLRLPPRSVTLSAELAATPRPSLEHLGGWSNTGYLELYMTQLPGHRPVNDAGISAGAVETDVQDVVMSQSAADPTVATVSHLSADSVSTPVEAPKLGSRNAAHGWTTVIETINGKDHLQTLKRTRGGVGSSRHDESQRNIDSFFKRQKVD